jgi:hypothetical protein
VTGAFGVGGRRWGGGSVRGVSGGRELVGLHVTGGEPYGEDWVSRVEGLGEKVGGEGEGAQGIEHSRGVPLDGRLFFPCTPK